MEKLKREVGQELKENILPFWTAMVDDENGGFYGRMNGEGILCKDAPKGAVLNARILWAFAAAYRTTKDYKYLELAIRAKRYLIDNFYDNKNGGIYWMLNADGTPRETKKQIYALGFAIYGLSELYRSTNDAESLEYAVMLYESIEQHAYDEKYGGYFEAFTQDWGQIDDVRLSEKDANDRKTMNTHLHILEPYTNLYRVWPDINLKCRIKELMDIFLERIYNAQIGHFDLFFADDWKRNSSLQSYGHDIEAAWLLWEAACVIDSGVHKKKLVDLVKKIADVSLSEAFNKDGGMEYEYNPSVGIRDNDCHWWVQAESVVGFLYAYKITGNNNYLNVARSSWDYIKRYIIDKSRGEWYWSLLANGKVNMKDDKAGPWKCPYHNTRMCLEVMNFEVV